MKKKAISLFAVLMLSFTFASVVGAYNPYPYYECTHSCGSTGGGGTGGGGVGGPVFETP